MKNPVWWEKTVEYYFVLNHLHGKVISPLDGFHEGAGDAILQNQDNKWIIIEFKRNDKCRESEKKKFINWRKAVSELSSQSEHHFLIYGKYNSGKFGIGVENYFDPQKKLPSNILDAAICKEDFFKYLSTFLSFKKVKKKDEEAEDSDGESGSGGSSGDVGYIDYSVIFGLDEDGGVITCLGLEDFKIECASELKSKVEKEQKEEKKEEKKKPLKLK
ncbi:hypothetical protein [Chromobacterium violaceum]|uniref:hypothetical protein n=1 Tax=Chromobacterium violaceum TaxID=536 RepID=UPI0012D35222|nr:hypothetical protein [Chromobacterium violaceum]